MMDEFLNEITDYGSQWKAAHTSQLGMLLDRSQHYFRTF